MSSDETSGWDDQVQEYLPGNLSNHNSMSRPRKMTREDTSGWDDQVQEYGKPVTMLPSVPGQSYKKNSTDRLSLAPRISKLAIVDEPIVIHSREPSSSCTRTSQNASKSDPSVIVLRGDALKACYTAEQPDKKDDIVLLSSPKNEIIYPPDNSQRRSEWLLPIACPSALLPETHTSDELLAPTVVKNTMLRESKSLTTSRNEKIADNKENDDPFFKNAEERIGRSWSLFADNSSANKPVKGRTRWKSNTISYVAKSKTKGKKLQNFEFVRMEQIIMQDKGAVSAMKFNSDGKFLATGGQDAIVRVWIVMGSKQIDRRGWNKPPKGSIINPIPYREFRGHTGGIIDLDWSLNHHILSSSYDTTVMLWHIFSKKCVWVFKHFHIVWSVRFHPTDSRYYVSGSSDTKIRLWHIEDRRLVDWCELETEVTAVAFSPNGKIIVAGLDDGQCVFLLLEKDRSQLTYHNKIECRNGRKSGRKVTSVEFVSPGMKEVGPDNREHDQGSNQCLVATHDSRIRLFTLENYQINLRTKYKGHKNIKYQIAATFSHDGKFVISGSDDGAIYIWNKQAWSRTRSGHAKASMYEVITAPGRKRGPTTVAIFAPKRTVKYLERERTALNAYDSYSGLPKIVHVILSADMKGIIRIFVNYQSLPPAQQLSG